MQTRQIAIHAITSGRRQPCPFRAIGPTVRSHGDGAAPQAQSIWNNSEKAAWLATHAEHSYDLDSANRQGADIILLPFPALQLMKLQERCRHCLAPCRSFIMQTMLLGCSGMSWGALECSWCALRKSYPPPDWLCGQAVSSQSAVRTRASRGSSRQAADN